MAVCTPENRGVAQEASKGTSARTAYLQSFVIISSGFLSRWIGSVYPRFLPDPTSQRNFPHKTLKPEVDKTADLATVSRFDITSNRKIALETNYAEYEVSRTPDAQQHTQAPAQPQL
jgi:hypothetical protein